jgi:hypothetical protein
MNYPGSLSLSQSLAFILFVSMSSHHSYNAIFKFRMHSITLIFIVFSTIIK